VGQNYDNSGNRRIAKNAVMLYVRMFFTMIVGLYTSRVVLNVLGVEDYGIYGVVGGVIGMLGFLNASMSGATSRFLTFELGRGDQKRLADTFSSALIVHMGIALFVLLIAETVGLWFLTHKLVIPAGRMPAAHWVYQMSILSALIGITQVPYNATIIAHEKMDVYAWVEILHAALRLLIVYLLTIGNFDKLILYAALGLAVSVFIRLIYRVYCIRHFSESHFHWLWDKSILKPLLNFSGWDLYGNMAFTVRSHVSNFILNVFYGVVLNAASGIASTVQGIILSFSSNVVLAFKPQIIKTYSVGDYDQMNEKLRYAAKVSIALMILVTVPVFVKCAYVLKLWLKIVPEGTVVMTRFTLLINLASCMSSILLIGIHATGKMITTGAIGGTMYLLSLPLMYWMLKIGLTYRDCYLMFLIITALFCAVNAFILKKQMPEFAIVSFINTALLPILIMFALSLAGSYALSYHFQESFLGLILFSLLSCLMTMVLSFVVMLNRNEKRQTLELIKKRLKR
jgi:Na+-driven multidrug efflux pump